VVLIVKDVKPLSVNFYFKAYQQLKENIKEVMNDPEKEGRKLKRKVNSKNVKLRNNKIVEKTKTPRKKVVKKTIQRGDNPVKTVRKTVSKKSSSKNISGRATKIGAAVGAAIGAGIIAVGTRNDEPTYKNRATGDYASAQGTLPFRKETTHYIDRKPETKTHITSGRTYKGTNNIGLGATFGGVGSAFGAAAGAKIGSKMQTKSRKTVNKTVRTKEVNGVSKSAVKAGMKTMRSKRRGK